MGKAQDAQRRFLQPLKQGTQCFTDRRMTLNDVVVSTEDDRAVNKFHRLTCEKLFKVSAGVDIDVRRQFVTHTAGQVVYKKYIAEMILAFPINTVRFKGIAAVGAEKDDPSAGFQDPDHLVYGQQVIRNMLDHFMAQNQVISVGSERQVFPAAVHDIRVIVRTDLLCRVSAFIFDLNTDSMTCGLHEAVQIRTDTASVLKDHTVDTIFRVLGDKRHAALLSVPPYIGGFSAFSCFAGMFLSFAYVFH